MGTRRHTCSGDNCKICKRSNYMAQWRENNRSKLKQYHRDYNLKYYQENKDLIIQQTRKYYESNKEEVNVRKKEYFDENKDYFLALKKKYWRDNKHILGPKNKARYEANSERYNKNHYKNWKRSKYYSDPLFRLNECIAANLRGTFKYATNKKDNRTAYYTGCSVEFLKDYLTKLFLPGMSWDNFGRGGWVIDHIIPKSKFALDEASQKKCWHYTNLRPMWEKDNLRKGVSQTYISLAEFEVLMCMF